MTNAQIIFERSVTLMNSGIIKGSGKFLNVIDENGNESLLEIPEPLHTFNEWKKLGYVVRRGQKAKAFIQIWKYAEPKAKDDEASKVLTEEEKHFFMKNAAFFAFDQLEPIRG